MADELAVPVADSPAATDTSSQTIESTSTGADGANGAESQTDESILGIQTEVDEQPVETSEETTEQPAETTQQEVAPNYDWAKPLFKQYPQLQSLVDRAKNYEKLGPIAELSKIASIGSAEQLQQFKSLAEQTEQVDLAYSSGDPEAQNFAIKQMYELDPEAFEATLPMSVEFLRSTDPQRYEAVAGQMLTDLLTPQKFPEHIDMMANALSQLPQEALANPAVKSLVDLVGSLVGWAKGKQLSGQKDAPQLNPQAQRLEAQQQQIAAQKTAAFTQQVSDGTRSGVEKHLDTLMANIVKEAAFSPDQIADIRDTVINEVGRRLASDQTATMQFRALLNKSVWLEKAQDAVDARVSKAKSLLSTVLQETIDKKTKLFLGAVQARKDKIAGSATRREVAGTSPRPVGKAPIDPKKARTMTDDEILNS